MPTICIDGEETFEVDSDGQRVNEVVLSLGEYRDLQNAAYKRQAGVLRIADELHRARADHDLAEIDRLVAKLRAIGRGQ